METCKGTFDTGSVEGTRGLRKHHWICHARISRKNVLREGSSKTIAVVELERVDAHDKLRSKAECLEQAETPLGLVERLDIGQGEGRRHPVEVAHDLRVQPRGKRAAAHLHCQKERLVRTRRVVYFVKLAWVEDDAVAKADRRAALLVVLVDVGVDRARAIGLALVRHEIGGAHHGLVLAVGAAEMDRRIDLLRVLADVLLVKVDRGAADHGAQRGGGAVVKAADVDDRKDARALRRVRAQELVGEIVCIGADEDVGHLPDGMHDLLEDAARVGPPQFPVEDEGGGGLAGHLGPRKGLEHARNVALHRVRRDAKRVGVKDGVFSLQVGVDEAHRREVDLDEHVHDLGRRVLRVRVDGVVPDKLVEVRPEARHEPAPLADGVEEHLRGTELRLLELLAVTLVVESPVHGLRAVVPQVKHGAQVAHLRVAPLHEEDRGAGRRRGGGAQIKMDECIEGRKVVRALQERRSDRVVRRVPGGPCLRVERHGLDHAYDLFRSESLKIFSQTPRNPQ